MHTESESLFFKGNQHLNSGDLSAAAHCYQQACTLNPDFSEGWANLALVLEHMGDIPGAHDAYLQALHTGCDAFELHLNFGAFLATQHHFDAAQAAYARALQLDNASAALWSNLGALYLGLQHDEDAQTCLQKALQLHPGHAGAQVNLAYLYLRNGDFRRGWQALEARDWYHALQARMPCPRWRGGSLQGMALLLCDEAGHGDMIQFVRYVPLLKALGATHITLLCHPALLALMSTVAGLDTVCGLNAPLPGVPMDVWSPLLSLPYHLHPATGAMAMDIPYVQPDATRTAHWREQLTALNGYRVGLVWKGNPAFENDAQRSLAHLQQLMPVLQVPGIGFVSLQKGSGESEAAALQVARQSAGLPPLPLLDAAPALQNFADTAALLSQLDLVITVDTATAHLAGALGLPCWVLLPHYMADWRWGASGTQSAWYPHTMRLWRQSRHGAWPEVIDTVAQALKAQMLEMPS